MSVIAASPANRMEELAASVTIGAERAGTKAAKILAESAAAGLRARAGFAPTRGVTTPQICEPDSRPVCSPRAGGLLTRLVTETDWPLVQEWSRLAAERGQRAPEAVVPALLEAAATRAELAAAVRPVTGRLGEWLAGLNPQWRKSGAATLPVDLDERWLVATTAERRTWLALLRTDEPVRAITLLRSTWAQDAAGDRQKLIAELLTGLSPADEDFLDECLKDRSKGVRLEAAALLARLPGSKYVARMIDRAGALITVADAKKGLLRKKGPKLTVEPPKDWDPVFEADGLEEKPAANIGKRAWWLRQIVACVPTKVWSERTGYSAGDLVAALEGSDYEKDVLAGWWDAAARYADVDWALALIDRRLAKNGDGIAEDGPLWLALPPEGRERVVLRILESDKVGWHDRWTTAGTVDHAWSERFARVTVKSLDESLPKKAVDWWQVGDAVERLALHCHPAVAPQLEETIVKAFGGDLPPSVEKAVGRLRLRADMHKEFAS